MIHTQIKASLDKNEFIKGEILSRGSRDVDQHFDIIMAKRDRGKQSIYTLFKLSLKVCYFCLINLVCLWKICGWYQKKKKFPR